MAAGFRHLYQLKPVHLLHELFVNNPELQFAIILDGVWKENIEADGYQFDF